MESQEITRKPTPEEVLKLLPEGYELIPVSVKEIDALLAESIFFTNASLDSKLQLPSRTHSRVKKLARKDMSADEKYMPTNKDALTIYTRWAGKLEEERKIHLASASLRKGVVHDLETYLVAIGILQVPYQQSKSK